MHNRRNIHYTRANEDRIRGDASSRSIHKTIKMVETRLGIELPRGNTPSESRDIMVETLAILIPRSARRIR